jgi:2-dehydro-3-deoxyglucarate aldolase/4-hydroxy-2-oxoheptanedioate aldolase
MDLPVNHFKRAITAGKPPVGTWLSSGSPSTAEALGCAGFDFLVVDTEHTPIDVPQMTEILRAIAGTPAQAIVRPPWNDMVMIKRLLDAGAQSLLLPFVQDEHEAKRAVASTRYPPAGVRGVAGTHRGSRFGTFPAMKARRKDLRHRADRDAFGARDSAIAAVDGIDSIFSGPTTSRRRWAISATRTTRRGAGKGRVRRRTAASKPCGIIGGSPRSSPPIDYGYSWVAVNSDMGMMVGRARNFTPRCGPRSAEIRDAVLACADGRRRSARRRPGARRHRCRDGQR